MVEQAQLIETPKHTPAPSARLHQQTFAKFFDGVEKRTFMATIAGG